jgi:hypothetical protein
MTVKPITEIRDNSRIRRDAAHAAPPAALVGALFRFLNVSWLTCDICPLILL